MTPTPIIIRLYAAGSLRAALADVAEQFASRTGVEVETKFGPSGLLKDEIEGGAPADVFASANMAHPHALNKAGKSGPVLLFARNKLCALVKPGLNVDGVSLLDRMLDPAIKLGTSTPQADPSGDYALDVFRKADVVRPGAGAELERKAFRLTGNAASLPPPPGRAVYGWHVAEGHADIFPCYRTAAAEAQTQYAGQQIVELPAALAVGGDYGLTVIVGAPAVARQFADFVMSAAGRYILVGHGFAAGESAPGP